MKNNINHISLVDVLEQSIHNIIHRFPGGKKGLFPSATIAMVRIQNDYFEYLVLGDSYLFINEHPALTVTDERLHHVGVPLREKITQMLQAGYTYDSSVLQQQKLALVRQEIANRNRQSGYWIVADDPKAARHAYTGKVKRTSEPTDITIMSDGFARIVTHYRLFASWQVLNQYIWQGGLVSCLEKIRALENSDYHGQKYPRFSRYDDASVISIKLNRKG